MLFSMYVLFLFSKWVCVIIWEKGNKQPQRKNCQEKAGVGEAGAGGWYLQGPVQVLRAEVCQCRESWVRAGEEVTRAEVWGWQVKVPLSLLAQWVHSFSRGAWWRCRGEELPFLPMWHMAPCSPETPPWGLPAGLGSWAQGGPEDAVRARAGQAGVTGAHVGSQLCWGPSPLAARAPPQVNPWPWTQHCAAQGHPWLSSHISPAGLRCWASPARGCAVIPAERCTNLFHHCLNVHLLPFEQDQQRDSQCYGFPGARKSTALGLLFWHMLILMFQSAPPCRNWWDVWAYISVESSELVKKVMVKKGHTQEAPTEGKIQEPGAMALKVFSSLEA